MLEILNRYSHGLASIPLFDALRRRGCLARLAGSGPLAAPDLAREFSANRAYLDVALRLLTCLGWIRPTADGRFEATAGLAHVGDIPDDVMDLYRFPFEAYVRGESAERLERWVELSEARWKSSHPYLPDFLDGLLVLPLLLALRAQARSTLVAEREAAAVRLRLDVEEEARREIERLCVARGWAARADGELRLNRAGRFVFERVFVTATVASYRPMFTRAEELLFGDAARVFARDADGHETHVERTVNVVGSGFQHEKYFTALSDVIVRCFAGEAYASQPKYLVDMGCGDGSLLRRLYETVRDRTPRGKVLDAHPLIPVAVDFNEKALVAAGRTLADIEHLAVRGDIGDPLALVDTLRAHGVVDLDRVLHVRSFLDHDRPYRAPQDRAAAEQRARLGDGGIFIDAEGGTIPPGDMLQSTVEHLRRWADVLNPHGLLVLEVHSLSPAATARHLDESESFHFDAYHALSHQYLLDAPTFLACAAEAGLFCRDGHGVGFPRNLPFTRITLNHFERRPYIVRRAAEDDPGALAGLRQVWGPRSRAGAGEGPAPDARAEVFVLENEQGVVASVRCERDDAVRVCAAHARPGAPAQPLHDLLRFVEQYWALADAGPVADLDACRAAVAAPDEDLSRARAVARALQASVAEWPFAEQDDPRAAERELGALALRWLFATLQSMGALRDAGEVWDVDALQRHLGVAPKYDRYFDALVRRLEGEGLVALRGRRLETTPFVRGYPFVAGDEQIAEFRRQFEARHPASVGLMNLTVRCLERYEEILTGRIDVTDVVFPEGRTDVFTEVFRGGAASDYFNRIVADAVHELAVRLGAGTPAIRILEVGGGTGATTAAILERLLGAFVGPVEFCFSDVSRSFLRSARQRFAEQYPSVEYRVLDIEEDFERQGFAPRQFDVVVAANVLHDTHDVERALANVHGLLRPGGLLILDEYTSVKDCLLVSGALLHGYWLFQDPERRLRDSCLLGVAQWLAVLERTGFDVVGSHALPTQRLDAACTQSVLLCEARLAGGVEERPSADVSAEGSDRPARSRRAQIVSDLVEQHTLALLGEERASAYSAQRPLMDMGLDSIELVELRSLLERRLGVRLTPMFLFDHETPDKLTAALSEMVSDQWLDDLRPRRVETEATAVEAPAARPSVEIVAGGEDAGEPIAIVGVACRFPGGAASAQSFWRLLESGGHGIVTLPAGRWRWPGFVDVEGEHKGIDKAGFLERIDEFDAAFFRTSPKEAKLMDPQQRLLLELSWEAMEDAAHRPSELAGRRIGIFVGVCHGDYREVLTAASDVPEAYVGTGSACSLLANRISFFHDFKGPSLTVDTACSSSLVALHDAVTALRRGECEQALVGAANLLCSPTNSIAYYRAGMLSPTGTCRTFDAGADGYVRGEGAAMLLLKPLAQALADGDSVYGLVKGTAVNHGGQAASLTAPKPEAQAAVIEAAWRAAQVAPDTAGYIETHGTGTRLGDPVEIGGLIEAFRRLYRARGVAWRGAPHCGLGSVKTNVGHLEGAAGLAGVIKVLMALEHQAIPATLNFERLNPEIDLARSPFYIAGSARPWPAPQGERGRPLPRRAGVSSFGFGGANAHAVIEEYPRLPPGDESRPGPFLIPLSARNAERLLEQARRLLAFVDASSGDERMAGAPLGDVAYTLQVGREPMEERLAFVVWSRDELTAALRAYVAGERAIPGCHRGRAEWRRARGETPPEREPDGETGGAAGAVAQLASLWVTGQDVEWSALHGTAPRRRVHLPTYPFARERHWVDVAVPAPVVEAPPPVARRPTVGASLHPLLHRNTSDLREQRYSSTFEGGEFFLADHRVRDASGTLLKTLPAAAYLEMARAAVAQALPAPPEAPVLTLFDTVWGHPAIGADTGPMVVHIALSAPEGEGPVEFEIFSRDDERVDCQGRAAWGRPEPPERLALEALRAQMDAGRIEPSRVSRVWTRLSLVPGPAFQALVEADRGRDQLLARLRLPQAVEEGWQDYLLHPSLIDGALHACAALMEGSAEGPGVPRRPVGIDTLYAIGPCDREMVAWVRPAAGGPAGDDVLKLDVDLCDARGNVRVQMRGVGWRQVSPVVVESTREPVAAAPAVPAPVAEAAPARVRREISWAPAPAGVAAPAERKRPAAISLSAPGAPAAALPAPVQPAERPAPATRARVPLSMVGAAAAGPALRLFDCGEGVFAIDVEPLASGEAPARDGIARLRQCLDRAQREAALKVLLLGGLERLFPRGREGCNEAVEQRLYASLVSFPCPVIAVLSGDAVGAGFMAAALCDFMVCHADATYGYSDPGHRVHPTPSEAALFIERFGALLAQDLLYLATPSTGRALRAKGWACPVLPGDELQAHAERLAASLAAKPQEALRLLKQHLARHLVERVEELAVVPVPAPPAERAAEWPSQLIPSPSARITLETRAAGVLVAQLGVAATASEVGEQVGELGRLFAWMRAAGDARAVVLAGERPAFLAQPDVAVPDALVLELQRLIVESELPIVAAIEGDARGPAWLVGQSCDACVHGREGVYSAAGLTHALMPTAAGILRHRLGEATARELLLAGADYAGADLHGRIGAMTVAAPGQARSTAVQIAESWARLPRATLAAWKQQTAALLQEKWRETPADWEGVDAAAPSPAEPGAIVLRSRVVSATAHADGIVVVTMEDRDARNMFSEAFLEGLEEAFAHIERTPAYKVVILTGYDSFFASGGTKEALLAIQEGKHRFTDFKAIRAALDCPLPVIAAMQGHGIGAGWTLGLLADIALLSDESQYVSPYMDYGFTPGAGATYVLGATLGADLARESLLTAQPCAGRDLRLRGLALRVLPRADVYPAAIALARQIARQARGRLIGLKRLLTRPLQPRLDETYRLELAMHEKTFVGRAETLARIERSFEPGVVAAPTPAPQAQAAPVASSSDGEALSRVIASLRALLAKELQMRAGDIDDNAQFVDLGLDSITGVTWVRKVNQQYGTAIRATQVYSHTTLAQFGRHVHKEAEQLGTLPVAAPDRGAASGRDARSGAPAVSPVTAPQASPVVAEDRLVSRRTRSVRRPTSSVPAGREPVAIIGMAGQFPQATNLEEFWRNIAEGRDCITRIPASRWDVDAFYRPGAPVPGRTNSQWLGALEHYDRFDPLFFNISPSEAESMDPQQRLFLEASWHGIEDAGYDARSLSGSRCGVFVGCAASDYHQLSRAHQLSAHGFTGGSASILAARISYFLNLQGPCLSIDTACSSSLVALAQACDSLASGASDVALAGGVYVMAGPEMHIKTAQAGMLSPHGRCFTFDERADGMVPGEGVGVVVLKRLADARRDGDIIHAVIQGWGVNQDGKTNGITAPNAESQARLEQDVYDRHAIDPASIQLVEAHGTGTKLGDPIEVEGLKAAFGKYTRRTNCCALGSVKSNIGHCLWAAGIAGVLKLVLALKHRQLPPTIHFEKLNEHIDLGESPFYVSRRLQSWAVAPGERRQAAISSFGFSGTNAHVVLGECPPALESRAPATPVPSGERLVVPLSARTAAQLRQKAVDLLSFIRNAAPPPELTEIAYTLQVGREAMDERVGFLAGSIERLAERLEAYVESRPDREDIFQGQARRGRESLGVIGQDDDIRKLVVDNCIASRKLGTLLDLWVKGLELDWKRMHGDARPRRVSLPTYPFARERYWIETTAVEVAPSARATAAALHPLLHRDTSEPDRRRYTSTLTGDEFFLADHQIRMDGRTLRKVLPGVTFLEMARAAIEHAALERPDGAVLELHNTVWLQPVVVVEPRAISIELTPDESGEVGYEISSDEGGHRVVHCQGRGGWRQPSEPERLDLERLRSLMQPDPVEPASVYAAFARTGGLYGPAFQGITAIHQGGDELLACLRLPAVVAHTSADYVLHPTLMDSALQGYLGLVDRWFGGSSRTRMPFALESLRILSACAPRMWAWMRYAPGSQAGDHVVKLDIDLCDELGQVCVRMAGFAVRPLTRDSGEGRRGSREDVARATASEPEAAPVGLLSVAPVWDAVRADAVEAWPGTEARVVVIGGDEAQHDALRQQCPGARVLALDAGATIEGIEDALSAETGVDHVVWIVSRSGSPGAPAAGLIEAQDEGVLRGFRLIKALLKQGRGAAGLGWTVITHETLSPRPGDPVDPAHASVHGLVGAMAREYPNWSVRLVDVSGATWPWSTILRLPRDERAEPWVSRDGRWYRRRLLECEPDAVGSEGRAGGFRRGGVYVVIGGAGGVGEALSEYLIRAYDARVAWIGRRAQDAAIEAKQRRVAAAGGEPPLYLSADARQHAELERACDEIRQRWGRIDGVVHSAIVLADRSLANMGEDVFRAALSAKVDTAVRLRDVFGREPLDFVLYLSSVESFLTAAGQSNYAAGCTFIDAFAHAQAASAAYPVKVMNWGYWGRVGVVAGADYQERLARRGWGSLDAEEGMAGLERLLRAPLTQMGMVRTSAPAAAQALGVRAGELLSQARLQAPSVCARVAEGESQVGADASVREQIAGWERERGEVDRALARMLWAQVSRMAADGGVPREWTAQEWRTRTGVVAAYGRWLDESLRILLRHGYLEERAGRWTPGAAVAGEDECWSQWQAAGSRWEQAEPGARAQANLVDATLRRLVPILRGQTPATDVMFPGSSLALVEGFYKNNAVADYFNDVMADVVERHVAAWSAESRALRLLELGAGTGASSAAILRELDAHREQLAEYCYSDISKTFVVRGEQAYGAGREYLRGAVVDVEQALEEQGVERGAYDVVIAANVLHATRRLRETLRHAKAALKANGILVLNEIAAKSVYTHLTFGLLAGWWAYEDEDLRMQGNPGLGPEAWQRLLEEEGFRGVRFPARVAHGLGQQIVVAASDGVMRLKRRAVTKPLRAAAPLAPSPARPAAAPSPAPAGIRARAELPERVERWLVEAIGVLLKVKRDDVDLDRELSEFGFDSISLTGFANYVNQAHGLELMPTIFFEHPTVRRLTRYLVEQHGERLRRTLVPQDVELPSRPVAEPVGERVVHEVRDPQEHRPERMRPAVKAVARSRPAPADDAAEPIAIIGMSGRLPGAADLDGFWENLKAGRHSIVEIPPQRWDWRALYGDEREEGNRSSVKWGAFIEGVDEFDPLFFGISPREAKLMDPQHRLMMTFGWKAIEDAGYRPRQLAGSRTGIFVGTATTGYGELLLTRSSIEGHSATGWAPSIGPHRLSYLLDLHGPSEPIETACSSSLVAVHRAVRSILDGECDVALAGGVNTLISPGVHVSFSKAGMLSPDGRCKTFSSRADGFVRGEGVGMLVLKRLSQAERDGDHIYGLIRGSAENHGGRAHSLTAPNPQAQAEVIKEAYRRAGISPRSVGYIEAHGTGTALGDPIEINGLKSAFQGLCEELGETPEAGYCGLGSVKSNIGHLELSAGVAGLIKILLQLKHKTLAPSLHCEEINPYIKLEGSAFYVVRENRPWTRLKERDGREWPLRAGVSSFGFGGANAHVLVEEYVADGRAETAVERAGREPRPGLVVLSARDPERLREQAAQLVQALGRNEWSDQDLPRLAYTLQVGREAMDHRVALAVGSLKELETKLAAFAGGDGEIEGLYHGDVKREAETLAVFRGDEELREAVGKWMQRGKWSRVLELWVKGLEVEWESLYGEDKPRRLSLPTYPFARERYWIETTGAWLPGAHASTPGSLHPLLHRHASDLGERRYASTFTGREPFVAQQVAPDGRAESRVLPQVACLEMARAAIAHAFPAPGESMALELRDVVWAQPIGLNERTDVGLALLVNDDGGVDYEIATEEAGHELIHCQGSAVFLSRVEPKPLDLDSLRARMAAVALDASGVRVAQARASHLVEAVQSGSDGVLAQLRLAAEAYGGPLGYVLHPGLLDGALGAAATWLPGVSERGEPRVPAALRALHIVSACPAELLAWIRYAPEARSAGAGASVDVDLCDRRGRVCVQMRGLSWAPVAMARLEASHEEPAPVAVVAPPVPAPSRREIALVAPVPPPSAPGRRPAAITLATPGTAVAVASANTVVPASTRRAPIVLTSTPPHAPQPGEGSAPAAVHVRLYDDGQGVFSIHASASTTDVAETVASLRRALDRAQAEDALKVLLLSGLDGEGWRGREAFNAAVEQGLYRTLASFACPVLAVLPDGAAGAGFLAAAVCDFMVASEEATYAYTDAARGFYPTAAEASLLGERFGAVRARDLMYVTTRATGRQLRARGWTCPIVPAAEVETHARRLAASLALKRAEALTLLKRHLTRDLVGQVDALQPVAVTTETPSAAAARVIPFESKHFRLDAPAARVLLMTLRADVESAAWSDLVSDVERVVSTLHGDSGCRALVLADESPEFLASVVGVVSPAAALDLWRVLAAAEIPVVAALTGNARGLAWLIGEIFEASVHSRTGVYSSAGLVHAPALARTAAAVLTQRFGDGAAREILLSDADYAGADFERRAFAARVADAGDVLPTAVQLARSWADLPQASLMAWKKQALASLEAKLRPTAEACDEPDAEVATPPAAPIALPLESRVVSATLHPDGVVVVKMEDRQAKNMFADALLAGLEEAFARVARTPACKVVILTGYDSYFASGGTRDNLLAIQQGRARFTDVRTFQLALDCPLPVIAAMQGHAIGGGWTLGMFADVVLLSEESRYVSPYMDYGFTPGAGATYILPVTIGHDLTRESLLSAQAFAGRELKQRGLALRVVPRAEVDSAALALARQIARAPRASLVALKRHLTAYVPPLLAEAHRLELAMHERTFVGQSDALEQIEKNFAPEIEPPPMARPRAETTARRAPAERDALPAIIATLRKLLAVELQLQESDVDEGAQFVDLGLDSINAVAWVRKINETYGMAIEATRVYSHPTLGQLARYVRDEAEARGALVDAAEPVAEHAPAAPEQPPSSPVTPVAPPAGEKLVSRRRRAAPSSAAAAAASPLSEPIAVIGMAGQFPQARNLEEFWRNIAEGRDSVAPVPRRRWDIDACYQPGEAVPGKTNSRWLGALDEYDLFDPLFFNISPTEAESMDPQQRVFLQTCWHGIEHAGYDARRLSGSRCGVFVGCTVGDYQQLSREHYLSAQGFTGSAPSILAARVSYFLNLQGPCLTIDTACSSSLVAVAHACDSLVAGNSDLALAGGVCVMAGPELHIRTAQAGMLSPEGRCFTFDQRADGFVPAEGVGVVVLKRLADARRDRDIIRAVIRGWGVNQDGKTNGITAPNPESQTRLEQEVYDRFHIDPAGIQLIEAHGTGTKLGDPIEVEGLKNAFSKYTRKAGYCALGSVKSNIGHALTAAGIAGFIKLVLALEHRQLPPTLHFERLNEHINLRGTPFYVNTRLQAWSPEGAERRCGATSSFGFSGTNAHVVVGEYQPPTDPESRPVPRGPAMIVLSARNPEQLRQKARDLLEHVRARAEEIDLAALAYTLQVGRVAMEERLAFVADSIDAVAGTLEAHLAGREVPEVRQGQVRRNKGDLGLLDQDEDNRQAVVDGWLAQGQHKALLDHWVRGLELDWNRLYGDAKPQRIVVPLYPFAKERHWIEADDASHASGPGAQTGPAILHPLLHSNTSDLKQQRYSSTFTGDEFFLSDHRVRADGGSVARRVLPGVAYLEMARAAVAHAAPACSAPRDIELRNTVWLRPLVVAARQQVCIALSAREDGGIEYEVYSRDGEHDSVHCQGEVWLGHHGVPARLDVEALRRQMARGRLEPAHIYSMFARMGLEYGPGHRAITAIHLGERQVLTHLRLPSALLGGARDYVLHPSLMDGALQASIGLLVDVNDLPRRPSMPFVLESLRVVSACTTEMTAWMRPADRGHGAPEARMLKLDVDLCDPHGNVCVQMRGFVSRALDGDGDAVRTGPVHGAVDVRAPLDGGDGAFYQKLIADVARGELTVDEAVELGSAPRDAFAASPARHGTPQVATPSRPTVIAPPALEPVGSGRSPYATTE